MAAPFQATRATPSAVSMPSRNEARYALGLLLVVYVFNFVDRQILSILLESIKTEIHLSDTQLGFLGGIAFALFYTCAGIPIARWADTGVRRTIISIAILVWSAMTALTGLAQSFAMLLLARVGVGIGEAGCSPPAHSLISDYFPPERRGTALSIYSLGIPLGSALGTLIGAWVAEHFGWRMAFLVVGLPGVVLALIVRFTLREPVRGGSDPPPTIVPSPSAPRMTTLDVARFLARLPSFWHLSAAGALHAFVGYGAAFFVPSFFARVHEMGLTERGTIIASLNLVGMIGTFAGGALGDRLAPRDMRWYMWVPAIATLLGIPLAFAFYLSPTISVVIAIGVLQAIVGPMYLGPTFAMTQSLAKPEMRAVASAILLFILNLVGLGIGPWFIGFASDQLQPSFGAESIRYALLGVVCVGNAGAATHYFLAARFLRADLTARHR